jgi:nitrogen-specific signal transduction histidine kinase
MGTGIRAQIMIDDYSYISIKILDNIHRPVLYLKHDVSGTGFCLCHQVGHTHLGLLESYSVSDGDRIQSPKRYVLNKRQDDG